jgi:hypothetical protein
MAFLQAQVPHPKEITDYKRSTFEFDTKKYIQLIRWIYTGRLEKWFSQHWQMLPQLLQNYRFL